MLAKPAEETTVAEIVEVFEGPLALTDCCGEAGCQRNCQVSPSWQKLNNIMKTWLSNMTLTDMLNGRTE